MIWFYFPFKMEALITEWSEKFSEIIWDFLSEDQITETELLFEISRKYLQEKSALRIVSENQVLV